MALDASLWQGESRARLLAVAESGSTPVYVYDTAQIVASARALQSALSPTVARFFYAVKANPHPAVLRAAVAAGYGLECVSHAEVSHVLRVLPALPHERVLFTPNFAPYAEYAAVFALGGGVHVTVDSLHVLERWGARLLAGRRVLLRVDPGRGAGHHSHVQTAGDATKFGIAPCDVPRAAALAEAAGATVVGLHAHAGSGVLDDPALWAASLRRLRALAQSLPTVRVIDVGGGFGVVQNPRTQHPLDLAAVRAALDEVGAAGYELWVEPGRFLVAQAGVLLARVTQIKSKPGEHHFVGCDAGMNSLIRPALYGSYHHVVNLTRSDEPHDVDAAVVGPICESGDMLNTCVALPRSTDEGDILLIATAGAYGHSMSNHYNMREPAREVVL